MKKKNEDFQIPEGFEEILTTPVFKTPYNGKLFKSDDEVNDLPSLTVPDQTMSIPEILRRFASGLPLGGQRVPIYEGEDDIFDGVNPATLDISEKAAMAKSAAAKIDSHNRGKRKFEENENKARRKREIDAEVERRLKENAPQA